MKKIILIFSTIFLLGVVGFSQVKTMKVNIKQDTIISKQVVDSVNDIAVIQKNAIAKKNDSIEKQEEKITELQKATKDYFLGGKPKYFILFGLLWVFLGVVFVWCMTAVTGMLSTTNGSDTTWKWREFFKPFNIFKRVLSLIASVILAYAIMVFFDKLTHLGLTMFYCFGIGLTLDLLIHWAFKYRKKFSPIDTDSEPKTPVITKP